MADLANPELARLKRSATGVRRTDDTIHRIVQAHRGRTRSKEDNFANDLFVPEVAIDRRGRLSTVIPARGYGVKRPDEEALATCLVFLVCGRWDMGDDQITPSSPLA